MGNTVNQSTDNGSSTDNWDQYSSYDDSGVVDYSPDDPSQDGSQDDWGTIYPADGSQDPTSTLTVDGERQEIQQMESDPKLSASARDQLRALQGKLNTLVSESGDQLTQDLSDIEATLSALAHPTPENQKPLDEQLQDYLTEHPHLGKDKQSQIKKWIAAYQLDPTTKSQIKSEFKSLTQQVGNSEVYGSTISKLATVTGMKASDISDTFAKLQIKDPEHLTDDQIARLLPKLGGKELDAARKQVAAAQSALQNKITSAQKDCDKVNGDSKNKDFSSFKTLLDISRHTDPASLKLKDALQAEAKATIPILSVLKGVPEDKITAMSGAPKDKSGKDHSHTLAGCLEINGKVVNVVGNVRTGEIDFNNHANAWPKVNLHDYKLNTIGKEDSLPSWVDEYPCITANNDGSGGGSDAGKIAATMILGPIGLLF